jgi:sortase A
LLGQVILLVGFLSAALASWHLWGTGILTAGEQTRLSDEFQARLLATPDVTALPLGEEAASAASDISVPVAWDNPVIQISNTAAPESDPIPDLVDVLPEAAPQPGEALGRILIPKADVDWIVVEGVTPEDLRKGPGHIRGSAMPGQVGNTVIAGHRTTNGAPFYNLDRLERGDAILVESLIGTHTYEIVETRVVQPTDTWVATQWEGSWLTLTTCTPRFSSSSRLIVFARLVDGPNAEIILAYYGSPTAIPEL